MAVHMNKFNGEIFDNFMIKHKAPGAPEITIRENSDGTKWKSKSMDLFKNLDSQKTIVGYLRTIGLDAFKKGTKEPARIKEALDKVTWEDIQDSPMGGQSMFDQGASSFNSHVTRLFTKDVETLLLNNKGETLEDEEAGNKPYVVRLFNAEGVGYWLLKDITEYRLKKGQDYTSAIGIEAKNRLIDQGYVLDDVICEAWANLGDDQMAESGDISLKDLAQIKGRLSLGVERDKHFSPTYEVK